MDDKLQKSTTVQTSAQADGPPAGNITDVESTATTITITYDGIPSAASYEVVHRSSSSSSWRHHNAGSQLSYTITGLTPDSEYVVSYCGISASGQYGPYATDITVRTQADGLGIGSITSTWSTSTTITLTYASIPGAESYEVAYHLSSDSVVSYVDAGSRLNYTITGLTPDSEYVVSYCGVSANGVYGPYTTGITVKTQAALELFDWTYAGLDSSGAPVAGAEKQAGLEVYVTSGEWNTLVDLVNEACGTSLAAVSPGTAISASIVNEVAQALGVGTVTGGVTPITAGFFNQLRSAYNDMV